MNPIDDELLMAYADGELDAAHAAAVETQIAGDPDAREAVRRFRESRRLAGTAFAEEPVPPALEAAVRAAARRHRPADNVIRFPAPVAPRKAAHRLPLAAAIALLLAAGGAWWLSHAPSGRLSAALETAPSGTSVALDDGTVTPVATFRDAAGRWCREFSLAGAEASAGIACRAGNADWTVEVTVPTGPDDDYAPAGEIPSALDPTLDELGASPPVSPEAESEALANGWR
jgi:anti-sigma factor RsiW